MCWRLFGRFGLSSQATGGLAQRQERPSVPCAGHTKGIQQDNCPSDFSFCRLIPFRALISRRVAWPRVGTIKRSSTGTAPPTTDLFIAFAIRHIHRAISASVVPTLGLPWPTMYMHERHLKALRHQVASSPAAHVPDVRARLPPSPRNEFDAGLLVTYLVDHSNVHISAVLGHFVASIRWLFFCRFCWAWKGRTLCLRTSARPNSRHVVLRTLRLSTWRAFLGFCIAAGYTKSYEVAQTHQAYLTAPRAKAS